MNTCIRSSEFAQELFVDRKAAEHTGQIMTGIMKVRSPCLSDIVAHMLGSEAASHNRMQRFLQRQEPEAALRLLFNEEADYVIGDPTEIARPHAHQTEYDWLTVPEVDKRSRRYLFSGPFLLLKKRYRLPRRVLRQVVAAALHTFRHLIFAQNVRSFVPT